MSKNENCCAYSNNLSSWLRLSWCNLLERTSADLEIGNKIFRVLIDSYSSTARKYHNLQHVYDILDLIERATDRSNNINILQFAAWFHDYIYHPQASDNESRSAIAARNFLQQLSLNIETIEAVEKIILSTQKHQPLIQDIDNLIFLDLDLAILGTRSSQYKIYSRKIRQEYSHLSDRDYQIGRKKVLTQFLARTRIYYTDYFYRKLELKARKNIQTEIKSNCFIS